MPGRQLEMQLWNFLGQTWIQSKEPHQTTPASQGWGIRRAVGTPFSPHHGQSWNSSVAPEAGSRSSIDTGKILSGTGLLGIAGTTGLTAKQLWRMRVLGGGISKSTVLLCGTRGDPGRPIFESETPSSVLLKFCTGNWRTWKPIKTQIIFSLDSDFFKVLFSLIKVKIEKRCFGEAA